MPQASRALDGAVAEHVLGVRVEIRELDYVMLDPRQGTEELEVPQFSSDDGSAEGLAALLTQGGYEVLSEEFPVKGWQVILVPPGGGHRGQNVRQVTRAACGRAQEAAADSS